MKQLRIPFFSKSLFSAAMGDDILLSKKAKVVLSQYKMPLVQKDILEITQVHGIDMATRCYYEYLLQSEHGDFKKMIDQYAPDSCYTSDVSKGQAIKILIIPGMFYKEHPEVGADGQLVISIAQQCGFDAEILKNRSKGSIAENVSILEQKLAHDKASKIWLVSMSKGGAEVRSYLQSCNIPDSVKGWLNIAGINQGSPHAARKMSSKLRKLFYAILCKLMKVDYKVLSELHPEYQLWSTKSGSNKSWNKEINCIHVVPIPLRSHLQSMSKKRYEQLLSYGPNDGMVPVYDAEQLPGKIYPLWGIDHFMRMPQIGELLYQFFAYIAQHESLKIKNKK